jgi:hypothetical protein
MFNVQTRGLIPWTNCFSRMLYIGPVDSCSSPLIKRDSPQNSERCPNYYRQYIENFSSIAKPIYDLLESDDDNANKVKGKRGVQLPPNQPVTWTTAHQSALEKLIGCLIDLPLMAYPEPNTSYTQTLLKVGWVRYCTKNKTENYVSLLTVIGH